MEIVIVSSTFEITDRKQMMTDPATTRMLRLAAQATSAMTAITIGHGVLSMSRSEKIRNDWRGLKKVSILSP